MILSARVRGLLRQLEKLLEEAVTLYVSPGHSPHYAKLLEKEKKEWLADFTEDLN